MSSRQDPVPSYLGAQGLGGQVAHFSTQSAAQSPLARRPKETSKNGRVCFNPSLFLEMGKSDEMPWSFSNINVTVPFLGTNKKT